MIVKHVIHMGIEYFANPSHDFEIYVFKCVIVHNVIDAGSKSSYALLPFFFFYQLKKCILTRRVL